VQQAVKRLTGAYAIAVFCRDEPHRVIGARQGSPLIVGVGKGENFLASDAMALAGTTDQIIYLEEGDVVDLQLQRCWIVDVHGKAVEREVRTVHAHSGAAELGPYRHYMQKEIFEQPRAIGDTLEGVTSIMPELFGDKAYGVFKQIDSVLILACGTSYYAGSPPNTGWSRLQKSPSMWKSPANTVTATACRIRIRWSSPSRKVVKLPTPGCVKTCPFVGHAAHADDLQCLHQRDGRVCFVVYHPCRY
jgi:glucosamine--fructose-6-phosphate aminotransferase (isomerizing)